MQFASMSLGIFDFLIEWLTNFLIWIIGFFIDLLMALFAELFYSIGAMLLNIVDFIQLMFRKWMPTISPLWKSTERNWTKSTLN